VFAFHASVFFKIGHVILYKKKGVAIFAKACFGHPSPSKRQKLNATANACGCPSRPASLVLYPTRGIKLGYAMTRCDVGRLCISTTQTALRENAQRYRFWGLLGSCLAAVVESSTFSPIACGMSHFLSGFKECLYFILPI
jgi:hypothetical protein